VSILAAREGSERRGHWGENGDSHKDVSLRLHAIYMESFHLLV